MGVPKLNPEPMTVEEFFAFTDRRPDDEKWELIDGERNAYATLPSLTHYVVIAQDAVEAVVYARSPGFAEQRLATLAASIELPTLGIALSLSDIYRDTGLA